ncbi:MULTISPECIES: acireductone synthase [Frankia]|uniref:Enolase-phosphatase E1 n=1 Tax=Frankia alni (strain DSM 45986 / CECT 9034 / ACN14a) TaxID=326424 RepID=MTNC_FRAAA|nr:MULTISPECIES: acireductone synthase [Frankia]Q0RQV6.1 RecName: Full=Enolase-phosphatase E1; AltName: Full=2,3-diketo-5-methylthio-1-phosphopentane phosphatase [Frankia alni ACN14a]CAJ60067.1 enolase-phosphatase E-1; 2, 3-diketo-5-methylthio-1-phosphopentane phosphatase [Frankia alni ACN14a]
MSSPRPSAELALLDIEGTTSPTAAVLSSLFPYARARLGPWVRDHGDDPEVRRIVAEARSLLGEADAPVQRVVAALTRWSDDDRKVAPLKALQGLIWAAGFAAGELTGELFDDVAPALRRWHAAGVRLAVFSSGSVLAQRAWFAATPAGDLTGLFDGYFDIDSAGPKRDPAAYRRIATELAVTPRRAVFLSDVSAELDAASAAGFATVAVLRPGEPHHLAGNHPCVASFAEMAVDAA